MLWVQVFIKATLFFLIVLIPIVHCIDVLQGILIFITVPVVFVITEFLLSVLHVDIGSPITDDLRLKPSVIGSLVTAIIRLGCRRT